MKTIDLIHNRTLFKCLRLRFSNGKWRQHGEFIQSHNGYTGKWENFCKRSDFSLQTNDSPTSVLLYHPRGHIYTMYNPKLRAKISALPSEIEQMQIMRGGKMGAMFP